MGKKKGKGKKGGGDAAAAEASATPAFNVMTQIREQAVKQEQDNFVTLKMNLMNWDFMNFDMKLKTTTHLFTIKEELTRRHGLIKNLVICKDSYAERNELRDDTATLEELGITGAPEDADQPMEVAIFYEFKPCDHDDPLLLVWKS